MKWNLARAVTMKRVRDAWIIVVRNPFNTVKPLTLYQFVLLCSFAPHKT